MKTKKTILSLFLLFMTTTMNAYTPSDTITVRINGMHCGHCAHKVRNLLRQNEGVGQMSFDLERHTATIAYDPTKTCVDSIKAQLTATKRYEPTDYSKDDVIINQAALHIDDMFCGKCANRIVEALSQMVGVDSISPHVGKHYVTFQYDANKTHLKDVQQTLYERGFTPVRHYESDKAGYAYFTIPADKITEDATDTALALDGVADVFVNGKRGAVAITYVNTETNVEQLFEQLKSGGLDVTIPPAHQCKEEVVED